mmetsp:Transcript_2433/g.4858  ORF Transcript_2433/g.4858 Transcript_2433/m.4858 type:complete len:160 (-) Transcript_2433:177-656(-)
MTMNNNTTTTTIPESQFDLTIDNDQESTMKIFPPVPCHEGLGWGDFPIVMESVQDDRATDDDDEDIFDFVSLGNGEASSSCQSFMIEPSPAIVSFDWSDFPLVQQTLQQDAKEQDCNSSLSPHKKTLSDVTAVTFTSEFDSLPEQDMARGWNTCQMVTM